MSSDFYVEEHWLLWQSTFSSVCYVPLWQSQRRQWHSTPVILPGESHGRRSLVGCSPWGRKESNMTEQRSPGPAKFVPYLPPSQGSNYSKCHSGPKRGNVPSRLRPLAYTVFSFWNDPPSTHSTQVTPSIPQTSALMTFSQRSFSDPPYP